MFIHQILNFAARFVFFIDPRDVFFFSSKIYINSGRPLGGFRDASALPHEGKGAGLSFQGPAGDDSLHFLILPKHRTFVPKPCRWYSFEFLFHPKSGGFSLKVAAAGMVGGWWVGRVGPAPRRGSRCVRYHICFLTSLPSILYTNPCLLLFFSFNLATLIIYRCSAGVTQNDFPP